MITFCSTPFALSCEPVEQSKGKAQHHPFALSLSKGDYVSVGVEELDQEKLTPLLRLKYHDSIADAVADLGKPEEIGRVFFGFQKYLYQQQQEAVA
jgi:hypothetical protein